MARSRRHLLVAVLVLLPLLSACRTIHQGNEIGFSVDEEHRLVVWVNPCQDVPITSVRVRDVPVTPVAKGGTPTASEAATGVVWEIRAVEPSNLRAYTIPFVPEGFTQVVPLEGDSLPIRPLIEVGKADGSVAFRRAWWPRLSFTLVQTADITYLKTERFDAVDSCR